MIADGIAAPVPASGAPLRRLAPSGRTTGAHTRHSHHMRASERADDVADRRRRRLERAGFPGPLARRLARERGRDLHALIELADRGCPPDLAVPIALPAEAPAG